MNEHVGLGAYLLGGLAPGEQMAFKAHLSGCRQCQLDSQRLAGVGQRLRTIDQATARALLEVRSEDPQSMVPGRLLDDLRARRRKRRIAQGAGIGAVAAASVALGLGLSPALFPAQDPELDASYEMQGNTGAQVALGLKAKAWGTEIHFSGQELPTDGQLSLWVLDAAGGADQAGAWQATATGETQLTGAVPVMLDDISAIELRDAGATVLAQVPLPRQGAS